MNFEYTEEQKLFADSVRRFAQAHLAEGALARAHDPRFPFDVARMMGAQGLMGITIPEADGGQGGALTDAVIAIEQIAAVCPRSADVVQFGNFGPIRTFAEYGTPEQKARWLPRLLSGEAVMSLGMSEPEAGSAATDLKTSAKPDGSHYVLNGTKVFSTFSPDAAIFLVYVRYGPGVGGIGSVLVERGTPGFVVGPPQEFMSGEQWCELHFDDCRIPASNVLLGPGGFRKQMSGFNVERLGNTARSLAFGRYCFERAREHALQREQFGRPLAEFQGLQWKFADMAIKLESAQLLLYRAAANADRGMPSPYETAVAKAACNQVGFEVARVVADHGRGRLLEVVAGRILHAALPRLDDRRRLRGNPQEPHRRARVRPQIRPAPAQAEGLGGGGVNRIVAAYALHLPLEGGGRRAKRGGWG
jgi:alkylation response protein AidB-like acyl-CoA dehydrogenase